MKILHVTECFDGGVSRAIETIAQIYPADHEILWWGNESPSEHFSYQIRMTDGFVRRMRQVRAVVRDRRPDVVHLHSSWAGVYGRIVDLSSAVVYEPHCFVFDDPFRSPVTKAFYWSAEALLSWNTNVTVTLTPHEARLARNLRPGNRTLPLSNVPSRGIEAQERKPWSSDRAFRIVMVGRIAPQKDPLFFAELASRTKSLGSICEFVWIGDGDDFSLKDALLGAGVRITGWLGTRELAQELSAADLYFHSAAYEGFPLSVLDAAKVGLPILVRDLKCFEGFDLERIATVEEASRRLASFSWDQETTSSLIKKSRDLLSTMTSEVQIRQLDEIYREATK